ncbi:MAG: hypothetical protein KDE20_25945, partial [Caldilineaceae bacterium]|nr:hypothetical protein [Caldilineaceae bacterium]
RNPATNWGLLLSGDDHAGAAWTRVFAGVNAGAQAPQLVVHYALTATGASASAAAALPNPLDVALCPLDGAQHLPVDGSRPASSGARKEWATLPGYESVVVGGTVLDTYVEPRDLYLTTHDGHDVVVVMTADPAYLGPDNGGKLEVMWELRAFPSWVWPSRGDTVYAFGPLVYDCRHIAAQGVTTEVHPPLGVVAVRDIAADLSLAGGFDTRPIRRADIYFSNTRTRATCGGFCDANDPPYAPLNAHDYSFLLPVPGDPYPGARVVWWLETPPARYDHGDMQRFMAAKAPEVVPQVEETTVDGKTYLRVTLPFQSQHGGWTGPLFSAQSLYYGWTLADEEPPLRAFTLTMEGIRVLDESEGALMGDGEWYLWLNVADRWYDLRKYVHPLTDADRETYAMSEPLEANIILPSYDTFYVRTTGYEADSRDDMYGEEVPSEPEMDAATAFDIAEMAFNLGTGDWAALIKNVVEFLLDLIPAVVES